MRNGERYERKNNLFMARYFLEMIHQDYRVQSLRKPLDALEQHLDYYEKVEPGGRQPSREETLAEFRAVAGQQDARGPDGLTAGQRAAFAKAEKQLKVKGVFDPSDAKDARRRTLRTLSDGEGRADSAATPCTLQSPVCGIGLLRRSRARCSPHHSIL